MSPSPQDKAMIQAALAVADAGNRVLNQPNAVRDLGPEGSRLRSLLNMLQSALARYSASNCPPVDPFSILGIPLRAPACPFPILGFTIADDVVAAIVIVLVLLTKAAIDAGNAGRPAPKLTVPDVFRPMDPIFVLTNLILMMELLELQSKVKDIIKAVNECKARHPDRQGPCAELLEKFAGTASKLLQRITALRHHQNDPVSERAAAKSLHDLKQDLADITRKLSKCLGCDEAECC